MTRLRPIIHLRSWIVLILCAGLAGCKPNSRGPDDNGRSAPTQSVSIPTEDGPIEIATSAQPSEIRIGEVFSYSFSVKAPSSITLIPPSLPEPEAIAPFLIRDFTRPTIKKTPTGSTMSGKWTLDTFKIGSLEIPPLELEFVSSQSTTQTVQSARLTIQVKSTLEETGALPDIADIKQPAQPPAGPIPYWRWLGLTASLILLLLAALLLYRRLRKHSGQRPAEPIIPPHERALEALRLLSMETPQTPEAIDRFYVRLSEIVRVYVEQRFGIQAPDRTTEEFLNELEQTHDLFLPHQRQLLRSFLGECDLVKFARFLPATADIRHALDQAIAFVEGTLPQAQPPSVQSAGGPQP